MKVVTLAQYVKKEFLNLNNISFEITHTHLRWCGESSADLAGYFKLTNQNASEAEE